MVELFEAEFTNTDIRLEEPYDHYGNCGSVDVYVRVRTLCVEYLVALKTDPAIRTLRANEILRQ